MMAPGNIFEGYLGFLMRSVLKQADQDHENEEADIDNIEFTDFEIIEPLQLKGVGDGNTGINANREQ